MGTGVGVGGWVGRGVSTGADVAVGVVLKEGVTVTFLVGCVVGCVGTGGVAWTACVGVSVCLLVVVVGTRVAARCGPSAAPTLPHVHKERATIKTETPQPMLHWVRLRAERNSCQGVGFRGGGGKGR